MLVKGGWGKGKQTRENENHMNTLTSLQSGHGGGAAVWYRGSGRGGVQRQGAWLRGSRLGGVRRACSIKGRGL